VSPDRLIVFVNGRRVEVPPGSTALDAVRAWSADAAREVEGGARVIADSRGLPTAAGSPATSGAIFRLVSARAGTDAAADQADGGA
jgi:hypothetical protein